MKVEFEFEPPDGLNLIPVEGVAAVHCIIDDDSRETMVLYGEFGGPNNITAIGLHRIALREAEKQFDEDEDEG